MASYARRAVDVGNGELFATYGPDDAGNVDLYATGQPTSPAITGLDREQTVALAALLLASVGPVSLDELMAALLTVTARAIDPETGR